MYLKNAPSRPLILAPIKSETVFASSAISTKSPFNTFRIPSICRCNNGTLLAFAEGRGSIQDQSENVIVMRRLQPGANQWSSLQIVEQDKPNALNNPCVVVARNGTVYLMYQRYPAGLNERSVKPGFSPTTTCETFLTTSKDDGLNWTEPVNLTRIVKKRAIWSDACGPGIGIQLHEGPHRGRIVFPFNEGRNGRYDDFVVYSDDGKTWHRSQPVPEPPNVQMNECQIVERSDGSILMNSRNQGPLAYRFTAISKNGGETWDMAQPDFALPAPQCMGSIARLSWDTNLIALSNPSNQFHRKDGLVRFSFDDGRTWPESYPIDRGSFGYSCLVPMSNQSFGVLYEHFTTNALGQQGYNILFKVFSILKSKDRVHQN